MITTTKERKMKKINELKRGWLSIAIVCLMTLGAVTLTGCAGSTKTSTVTTQTTNGVSGGADTTVTTEKQVVTDAHPRGVIGGLFYTIGQVLLFPFKVIGSLF